MQNYSRFRCSSDHITAQDFDGICDDGVKRVVKLGVAVKASKMKSCFNIIPPIEYENEDRKSDIYIFVELGYLRTIFLESQRSFFFKGVADFLDEEEGFREIEELTDIPIWICGFSYHDELERVTEIPGQSFSNERARIKHRYVKSVSEMHNSDEDWRDLIEKL